jgi:hypothetical protein
VILFYGPQLLRDAGFGNNQDTKIYLGFLFLSFVYLCGSIFCMFKIDTFGRRKMM